MSRKTSPAKKTPVKSAPKAIAKKPVASTPVRNTAIPKVATSAPAAKLLVTQEMIAVRAFEISCGPNCGSEFENWIRAERELRGV